MSRFLSFLLVVLVAISRHTNALYTNESLAGCALNDYSASCTSNGYTGACVSIAAGCCSTGTQTSNLCPGSSDITREVPTHSPTHSLTQVVLILNAARKVRVRPHMEVAHACRLVSAL